MRSLLAKTTKMAKIIWIMQQTCQTKHCLIYLGTNNGLAVAYLAMDKEGSLLSCHQKINYSRHFTFGDIVDN